VNFYTAIYTAQTSMKVGIQPKEGRLILVWNDGKRLLSSEEPYLSSQQANGLPSATAIA
jgi:hypothetical protein